MLDIQFIREHKATVVTAARQKNIDLDIDMLLRLDEERRSLIAKFEALRAEQNAANNSIAKAQGEEKQTHIAKMKEVSNRASAAKDALQDVENRYNQLMLLVPAIPNASVPIGKTDAENVVLEEWGTKPTLDFTPKSHIELGERNDWIDFTRGVKFQGSRGYYLKGFAALLEMAVLRYAIDFMQKQGFTFMTTPTMGKDEFFTGTGHFPFARDEVFKVTSMHDEMNLTGTAEVPLMAFHAGEILDQKNLPKKYCAYSPCYRTEVGGYGKDTQGLYRVKQFNKIEQIILCEADTDVAHHHFEEIAGYAKTILQSLGLAYRTVAVCTGDMGAGKVEMIDIETWMPSRDAYGETHSCSRLDDWQTRRLKIRYHDNEGNVRYAYSLNNTVIATPRILIPLLETYQQKDGGVTVPKVLKKYM